jgi:hypothetical protein
MDAGKRRSNPIYNPFPRQLWMLKVQHQRELQVGRLEVVDVLRQMFWGEVRHTLQFDHDLALDKQIG